MAGENLYERRRIAESYARALYDVASERDLLEQMRAELSGLRRLIEDNPKLEQFLESPVIASATRRQLIDQLAAEFSPVMVSLFYVMNRRDRLGLLRELTTAFFAEDDRRQGRMPVKLTTAEPIEASLRSEIERALAGILRGTPMIEHRIRPEILGGFIALAGDLLIDASVKTQLSTIRDHLMMRGEDEIQSGRDYLSNQA